MKVNVDVSVRTVVRLCLVVIGFVAAIYMVVLARQPLIIIGLSVFLALGLNPAVAGIARKLPGRSRIGATALAYVIVLILLGGVIFLIVPPLVEQSSKLANTVPSLIDQASDERHLVDDFVKKYGLEAQLNKGIEDAKDQAATIANNIGRLLVDGVAGIFSGAVTLLLVLVLTFLMLIEGPMWLKRIWGLYQDPDKLKRHRSVVNKMYRVVVGFVNGQVLVAFIAAMSTMTVLLLLSLGFPLPANIALPMAAIIFVSGFIPMFGATIGAIIVTFVLLLNDITAALIFLGYFIVYQQIENNFISPSVQSKQVELSALSVLISIVIGMQLFGILGGIISIPIAGCIRVLVLDYLEHARKEREEKESKNPMTKIAAKLRKNEN